MYAAKKGRQVDVRVLSCEEKVLRNGETAGYYELTVDFYDLKGEVIVKTLPSATPYMAGDVIRCRYLDKTGTLLSQGATELQAGARRAALVFVIITVAIIGILAVILWAVRNVGELPNGVALLSGYFIGIVFTAVGVIGLHKKIKRAQDAKNMFSLTGVQVDYTVGRSTDSDGSTTKVYYPIYEYDWGGERRRLSSNIGASGKKYRTIGRQVHILVNPQTGDAYCQEDAKAGDGIVLLFGFVGILAIGIMLAISFGAFPYGSKKEASGADVPAAAGFARGDSAAAGLAGEKASVLEVLCYYEDMEREICNYWVYIYEDGSGRLLLFPMTTVSDRGINQEITFTVSDKDMKKILQWVRGIDVKSLEQGAHRTEEVAEYVSLQLYEGGERYYGGGYCYEGIYAEVYQMLHEAVPDAVWKELEKREREYYQ